MAARTDVRLMEEDVGQLVAKAGTHIVKNHPVKISLWVLGLLVAAFATGFSVSDDVLQNYEVTLEHAQEVDRRELQAAVVNRNKKEVAYHNVKGWFWSCDDRCQKAKDRYLMAQAEVDRITAKRNTIMTEARREVGIWSVFGVQDVRARFWVAWEDGKNMASRLTMYDAFFMMFNSREESAAAMILQMVLRYLMNLTIGLFLALVQFIFAVYALIRDYGEGFVSGLAFFLLVCVASFAVMATYVGSLTGGVMAGGYFFIKKAREAAIENERNGGNRARVQYHPHAQRGSGRFHGSGPAGGRYHYD